jgi:ankyrin repeat protein
LGLACSENKPELVKLLLEYGADPDLPGPNPPVLTSLRFADCMRYLIAGGADIRTNTALLENAVHYNQIEVVKALLDGGLDPNTKGDYYTPLNTSIRDDLFEITALLVSRGADPNLSGGEGFPIQVAATKPEAIKLLLGVGVDIKKPNVLEKSVFRDSIESIPILLDAGYPITGLEDDYYRPLNTAVRDNKSEILQLLLSRGADPNIKGGEGFPIQIAATLPEMLKILIAAGAEVKAAWGSGKGGLPGKHRKYTHPPRCRIPNRRFARRLLPPIEHRSKRKSGRDSAAPSIPWCRSQPRWW